jgi:hypothetical protein
VLRGGKQVAIATGENSKKREEGRMEREMSREARRCVERRERWVKCVRVSSFAEKVERIGLISTSRAD